LLLCGKSQRFELPPVETAASPGFERGAWVFLSPFLIAAGADFGAGLEPGWRSPACFAWRSCSR
jgi:hypothetical protein